MSLKAVVLAGGFGTRLSEETHLKPKPMVEVGGKPILWHILKIYSQFGIDIEIRPHNRTSIEGHRLSPMITLIEGSSIDANIVQSVKEQIADSETVLVILDSNHSRDHFLAELEAYSSFVNSGSYIVACDGLMQQVAGAPRTSEDWVWNNPISAINDFINKHPEFSCVEPTWTFNESLLENRFTYWPKAFLKRA